MKETGYPGRCYVQESQAKQKSYKPYKLIWASIRPQIQASETKAEKHKEVTVVKMEEQYNGETQAQVLILVQIATRYTVLGKQISLLTLLASGKTHWPLRVTYSPKVKWCTKVFKKKKNQQGFLNSHFIGGTAAIKQEESLKLYSYQKFSVFLLSREGLSEVCTLYQVCLISIF